MGRLTASMATLSLAVLLLMPAAVPPPASCQTAQPVYSGCCSCSRQSATADRDVTAAGRCGCFLAPAGSAAAADLPGLTLMPLPPSLTTSYAGLRPPESVETVSGDCFVFARASNHYCLPSPGLRAPPAAA